MAAWRLIDRSDILAGSWSLDSIGLSERIVKRTIVNVEMQSMHFLHDPAFALDSGDILEVFSIESTDEWVFNTPLGSVYVSGT